MEPKKVAVLGSTGSIGQNSLNVAEHLKGDFEIVALAARGNIDLLEKQARIWKPKLIGVYDEKCAALLQKRLPNVEVVGGLEGLVAAATHEQVDFVLCAISGTAGILPTVAAIEKGKEIGLANKEVLVSAGSYVMDLAKKTGSKILPIDSEHSALFQCLEGKDSKKVRRVVLTASGGPFIKHSPEELSRVGVADALKHPNWLMGPKNTIDSSTLMNKGLEVIEAHWLFGIPLHQIEVVVHPQSIVHSFVEFIDGSIIAQLAEPDMRLPIQYAMTYPNRKEGVLPPFDFSRFSRLDFFTPDREKFLCLDLAYHALKEGSSAPCYMNAVNEVLVNRFLKGKISWMDIGKKLKMLMERHEKQQLLDIETIMQIDACGREEALHI